MSQELIKVRAGLSKVSSDLKQGKFISAASAVREGARVFGRVPMIKNEQDELVALLRSACEYLSYDKEISALFPLSIEYAPGQEAALAATMNQLIEALEQVNMEEAVARHSEYKKAQLEKGHNELARGAVDDARRTMGQLGQDYQDEGELLLSIGEEFMQANLFEDAAKYLELAVKLMPGDTHLLNRLGIARRKLGALAESEQVYLAALELAPSDSNLLFNMGRLYLDWGRWEQAAHYAKQALEYAPDFAEAGKMAAYAEKKHNESKVKESLAGKK